MDIRQLRYFCTIYEEKQITKAAKILHMAQPPLSHQLRQLEEELGVPLIIRDLKKWEVTEAGHRLYERAKKVLTFLEDTKKEITEIHNGMSGTLSIGTSSICMSYLTEHLNKFHKAYPNVYIKIYHGDTNYLEGLLQQKQIDVALLLLPVEESNYSIYPLTEDPFVVLAPRQWEHNFPEEFISLKDVTQYDLLLTKRTSGVGIYETILNQFHKAHLEPKVVLDSPDISTILTLVATGMGITIIPQSQVHQIYRDQFKVLQLDEPAFSTRPVLIWLTDHYQSSAAKKLIEYFK
ncbi:LysR family transcriptional regulator [Pullulanibacillus sp. KACC 23026]|uniref:LysR family transcriptional regulator n=1 Tax=Pullulanibacillus sp. KACC 23026 TaxID=3028315 RepID=UPI0023B17092|nr:LysR family transcriptional regulator [Pullulanibacillus sp. KACC 23026]WEG11053.1 LysR family transcriptional regulator [Pullulanibacillus sp. KACC 23026]